MARVHVLVLLSLYLAQARGEWCLNTAWFSTPPTPGYYDALKPRSREWPPAFPPLSSRSWPESVKVSEPPSGFPQASWSTYWFANMILGVKVYKRVVYVSYPHNDTQHGRDLWKHIREGALEQILAAVWLYKDFPDVDLYLNMLDSPTGATTNTSMPFLQFVVINDTSPTTGKPMAVDMEHSVDAMPPKKYCLAHSSGFAIPTTDAWTLMSLSPRQLQAWSYCIWRNAGMDDLKLAYLDAKGIPLSSKVNTSDNLDLFLNMAQHKDWADRRDPVAFWRGSATGGVNGWDPQVTRPYRCNEPNVVKSKTSFLEASMLNKRIYASVMALRYPWLDIKVTMLDPLMHFNNIGANFTEKDLRAQLEQVVMRKRVELQDWVKKQLTLSIDGHGPPFRLPTQMLSMSPVVRVESSQRDWLDVHIIPGVHYESISHDLSDLASRTRTLIHEAANDSRRLQTMAINARNLVFEKVNLYSLMDSFMWSLLRLKEVLAYEVQPPTKGKAWSWGVESGWTPLQLPKTREWLSPGLKHIGQKIAASMPQNFY